MRPERGRHPPSIGLQSVHLWAVKKRAPWWLEGRDLIAALVGVGVPTFATIYATDIAPWPGWAKLLLAALFVAASVVIAIDSYRRWNSLEKNIERSADVAVQQRRRQRNTAMHVAFKRIFNVGSIMLPRKYEWTVFIYDEKRNVLIPSWPSPDPGNIDEEVFTFAPGKGATGQAWSSRQTVVRFGEEVRNDKHDLSPEQQIHYAEYNAVVATPIYDDDDDLIGVLAGITVDLDDTYADESNDLDTLRATASVVGTLLATLRDANEADD